MSRRGRYVFGQHAAQHQVVGLAMIAAAVVVLLWASVTAARVLAWVVLPVGVLWFSFPGHALIYGPFLWATLFLDLIRRDDREA